jgi:hypothetical protein
MVGAQPDASEHHASDRLAGAAIAGSRFLEYGREVGYSRPLARGNCTQRGAAEKPTRGGLIEERR